MGCGLELSLAPNLVAEFGKQVADLVEGLTKLDKIEFQSATQAQAENFRKMLLAMSQDVRVRMFCWTWK